MQVASPTVSVALHGPLPRQRTPSRAGEIIYLVDDDASVRDALSEMLTSLGREVLTFAAGHEYLRYDRTDSAACLIVDMMLPDMNGLDLQNRLPQQNSPPIIFISRHADIPATVRAIKAGAIEFLTKPISLPALHTAIETAFAQDRQRRYRHSEVELLRKRFSSLTPREREVLPLVAEGLLNKQAAAVLGIREVTLQVHRGQIMRKMAARSFAELVRMAEKLGISVPASTTVFGTWAAPPPLVPPC
jgi:FixJ family two-component response regulator